MNTEPTTEELDTPNKALGMILLWGSIAVAILICALVGL